MSIKVNVTCGDCKKSFDEIVKFFFDSNNVEDFPFPSSTCTFCGSTKKIPDLPFIYFNRNNKCLYYVIPYVRMNKFEVDLDMLNRILEDYLSQIEPSDQRLIRESEKQYIEQEIFLDAIENKSDPNSFVMGSRKVRITPALKIKIDPSYQFLDKEINFGLSKNEIGIIDIGNTIIQEEIRQQSEKRIREDHFALFLKSIENEQRPVITCGLTEIVMVVGSLIVIPILTNVLSDIITDLRHKDGEKRIEKNDIIKIKIKENGSKKLFYFEGPADIISKQLKECAQTSINTLTIPNSCHVASAIDDLISDPLLQRGVNTFRSIAKEYIKHFDPFSSIEFVNENEMFYGMTDISLKAKLLMDAEEYLCAYWIMNPYVDKFDTVEFIFNYALCISKLNDIDRAESAFYEVIRRYLLRMDLHDLAKFSCKSFSELREDDIELLKKNVNDIEINTKGEKSSKDANDFLRFFTPIVNDYPLEELREEAQLNFDLFQIQQELQTINNDSNLSNLLTQGIPSDKDHIIKIAEIISRKKELEKLAESIQQQKSNLISHQIGRRFGKVSNSDSL